MVILLAPAVKLINWNFDVEVTESGYEWQNKPVYLINYAQGLTGTPAEFWIDLEVSARDLYESKCNETTEAHNGFRKGRSTETHSFLESTQECIKKKDRKKMKTDWYSL
jgi:hypothetical protein